MRLYWCLNKFIQEVPVMYSCIRGTVHAYGFGKLNILPLKARSEHVALFFPPALVICDFIVIGLLYDQSLQVLEGKSPWIVIKYFCLIRK